MQDSAKTCKEAIEKFNKLITDGKAFMSIFQSSFETNTAKANAAISDLSVSLRTKKEALEKVRTRIQTDNSKLNSSITSKITKLQDDLAIESKIMDALALKSERVKVLNSTLR